jgi:hypothetical protein
VGPVIHWLVKMDDSMMEDPYRVEKEWTLEFHGCVCRACFESANGPLVYMLHTTHNTASIGVLNHRILIPSIL